MSAISLPNGTSITLGTPITDQYSVPNCTFFDSFTIVGGPQFSLTEFALARNDPKISKTLHVYRLLAIVEDQEVDGDNRCFALCQFYRHAKDTCVPSCLQHNAREILCTQVVEKVPVANFIGPVIVYQGHSSIPKGDKNTYSFFQYRYFAEEVAEIIENATEMYSGTYHVPALLHLVFPSRFSATDNNNNTPVQKRKLGLSDGGSDNIAGSSTGEASLKQSGIHKKRRRSARGSVTTKISYPFKNWVDNIPNLEECSAADVLYLLKLCRKWKDHIYNLL